MGERFTLVVGIGQPDAGDHAIGLVVSDALGETINGLKEAAHLRTSLALSIRTHQEDGASLLALCAPFDRIILIDAQRHSERATTASRPGDILIIRRPRILSYVETLRTTHDALDGPNHGLSISEALKAAAIQGALPDRFTVFSVIGENWQRRTPLSSATQAAIPRLIPQIIDELTSWGTLTRRVP